MSNSDDKHTAVCYGLLKSMTYLLHSKCDHSILYTQLLQYTKDCEDLYSLTKERDEVRDYLGIKTFNNIMNYSYSDQDKLIAKQAFIHYKNEHAKSIKDKMPFFDRLDFHLSKFLFW